MADRTRLSPELLARRIVCSTLAVPPVTTVATVAEVLGLAERQATAGEYGAAAHLFLQVLQAVPDPGPIRLALANVYSASGAWDRALAVLEAVLAADGANVEALAHKAEALYHQNRVAEAVVAVESAIGIGGGRSALRNALGVYRTAAGDFTGAEEALREAIRLDPRHVVAYHNLLDLRDVEISEELVTQMKSLAARPDLGEADTALLDFCISRCYRRRDQPAEEFHYLDRAKSVMARQAPWDAAGLAADVAAVLSVPAAQYAGFRNKREHAPTPVVICAMPRAGATLLEQIIAAHADVASIGEAGLATRATQAVVARHGPASPMYPAWFSLPEAALIFETAFRGFSDALAGYAVSAARFCEKSVNNDVLLGLWLLAWPEARVLHCRRDPLDICLSCYQSYFSRGVAFSNKLGWVARRYELHEQLMDHWKQLFPDRVLTVNYEDMVAEPRVQTMKVLDFLGLPWDEACMAFNRSEHSVRSASNWQVRQPLYRSSVHRWHRYREQLGEIMRLLT